MPKISVKIPEAEFQVLAKIARSMGLTVETLMQQETNRSIEDLAV